MAKCVWLALLPAVLAVGGACDSGGNNVTAPPEEPDLVDAPAVRPEYAFAEGVEQEYPEVTKFLRQFLETCLKGDYSGYRRMVTRRADPESRDRFEKILHAMESLEVVSITRTRIPVYDDEVFLVTTRATFQAGHRAAEQRGRVRRIAIMVMREDGEWRMGLAPTQLQPGDEDEEDDWVEEEVPTTGPSYPWDESPDY